MNTTHSGLVGQTSKSRLVPANAHTHLLKWHITLQGRATQSASRYAVGVYMCVVVTLGPSITALDTHKSPSAFLRSCDTTGRFALMVSPSLGEEVPILWSQFFLQQESNSDFEITVSESTDQDRLILIILIIKMVCRHAKSSHIFRVNSRSKCPNDKVQRK